MSNTTTTTIIDIPFDPNRTPRAQIEPALAAVPPRPCDRHPHELCPVDTAATIFKALRHDDPYQYDLYVVGFEATYDRCLDCPHNDMDHIDVERCAASGAGFRHPELNHRDATGRPLPWKFGRAPLDPDQCPRDQFNEWLARAAKARCEFGNQVLRRRDVRMIAPFESWNFRPRFLRCLQCGLEHLGITPDDVFASFDNFVVDPPVLRSHLEACRSFARAPKGMMPLLGNCGTGKTHLAIAILRERLRQGATRLKFTKHRDFLAGHWRSLRPVAFGEEPPDSPLVKCKEADLLVYDELTASSDGRACEDVLLELFEYRIGHFKPSIITANMSRGELEVALGTRLFDRLRRAAFALLEFGFESKRPSVNADYLSRAAKP